MWCWCLLGCPKRRNLVFQSNTLYHGSTTILHWCTCAPSILGAPVFNMAGGFEALGLAPELVRAVTEDLGYLLPTNVQVTWDHFACWVEALRHHRYISIHAERDALLWIMFVWAELSLVLLKIST